jgi:hypothetical protein
MVIVLPIVIASATAASSRTPVKGRFAADSWLFPFRFRRGMRKGDRHLGLCPDQTNITQLFGRGHHPTGWPFSRIR